SDPIAVSTSASKKRRIRRPWLNRFFAVQTSLLDEFLGRFHGPARRRWYLSDGGNFENLAGYELIRRRLPLIVIIDGGGDPDYSFADLSELVRKARLDFNAEINFLQGQELTEVLESKGSNSKVRDFFGSLDELRRGRWDDEPQNGTANRLPYF